MAGARVVPIFYNSTDEMLYTTLAKINGVLFTGGMTELTDKHTGEFTTYTETSNKIW